MGGLEVIGARAGGAPARPRMEARRAPLAKRSTRPSTRVAASRPRAQRFAEILACSVALVLLYVLFIVLARARAK